MNWDWKTLIQVASATVTVLEFVCKLVGALFLVALILYFTLLRPLERHEPPADPGVPERIYGDK